MDSVLSRLAPEQFPPLIREIPDAPTQLYVRGALPSHDMKWLAIVGSRSLTTYGRQVITHLVEGLRGYPIAVISGLAYGADAAAHRAAIDAGLPTVAVPGSGLGWDVLYPRAHVSLAREILERGGALISEFEPDFKTTDYSFPQRNRIMAGMSHAILVIEAKEKSGSLITARLATEYNRDLLVVPGSIFSAESRGTHQFLRLGATPVTSPNDILESLGIAPQDKRALTREDLSSDETRVLEALASPIPREELIESLDIPISEVNILLSTMEIKGLIVEELGVVRVR